MIPAQPLLHVVSPPSHVWGLDLRVVALAAFVAAVLFLTLAFPRQARRAVRRARHAGAARCVMVALAALAVLPSAVPYDHILPHQDNPADASVHAAHCHTSPGSCADAPVSSGPSQLLFSQPLLPPPNVDDSLPSHVHREQHVLAGRTVPPELRPPIA
jgi:hypothetical protein